MSTAKLEAIKMFNKSMSESDLFFKILRNAEIVDAGEGSIKAELTVRQEHLNHLGTMCGGMGCAIVDAFSGLSLLTAGENVPLVSPSININVTFISPAKLGDTIVISTSLLKDGNRIQFVNVDITEKASGKLICRGQHTHYCLKRGSIQDVVDSL